MTSWTLFRRTMATLLLITSLASACGHSTPPSPFPLGLLSVATKEDQPGFAAGGTNPRGFDISVAKFIANRLGYGERVNFPPISSPERDGVIPNGKANLIIATYSITPQREKVQDFAGPYLKTTQALLVRKSDNRLDDPSGNQWREGLKGCTATSSTSQQGGLPREGLPGGPKINSVDNYSTCVDKLLNRKIDFVFTDTLVLYGYEQQNRKTVKVVEAGDVGNTQYYGVALRRGQHDTCEKINQAISSYLDGSWEADFKDDFTDVTYAYPSVGQDQSNWQSLFSVNDDNITAMSFCQ